MLYGANADSCDSKGYTPISHASSAGSSANLIELLDSGHADVHITANNGKTALSKARSHETVMLLTRYGFETTRCHKNEKGQLDCESDLHIFLETHFENSSKAVLSQSISEVNEELLVLDFGHFAHTTDENNQMDLHLKVVKEEKEELLLHPIMQAFLDFKWRNFQKTFLLYLILEIIFVVLLTIVGQHFIDMIYCHQCDGTNNKW